MVLEKALSEAEPSAILVTGDIAHDEQLKTYYRYLDIMAAHYTGPILSLPGNHDHSQYFESPVKTEPLTIGNWLLVGLDSHLDGQVGADVYFVLVICFPPLLVLATFPSFSIVIFIDNSGE